MIISVTGTPGTGKTRFAKQLARYLGLDYINLSTFCKKNKLLSSFDKKRKSWNINLKRLKKIKFSDCVLDSHYSHELKSDEVIVLRLRPPILRNRLKKRKWSKAKIQENMEAEAMNLIAEEAPNALQLIGTGNVLKKYLNHEFVILDYSDHLGFL